MEDLLGAEEFEQSNMDGVTTGEEELHAEGTKPPSSGKLSHGIQRISSASKASHRLVEAHATQKSKQINKSLKTKEVITIKSIVSKEKPKVTIPKKTNQTPAISGKNAEKNAKKNAVPKPAALPKRPTTKLNSKPGPKSAAHQKKFADMGNEVTPMETNESNMPQISETSSSLHKCSTSSKSHKLRVTVPKSPKFATR
jgi:hypothetical protein